MADWLEDDSMVCVKVCCSGCSCALRKESVPQPEHVKLIANELNSNPSLACLIDQTIQMQLYFFRLLCQTPVAPRMALLRMPIPHATVQCHSHAQQNCSEQMDCGNTNGTHSTHQESARCANTLIILWCCRQ